MKLQAIGRNGGNKVGWEPRISVLDWRPSQDPHPSTFIDIEVHRP